jgi:hypothetical protein
MTRGEVKQAVEATGVKDCRCNFEEVDEKPSEHLLQVLRVADREIEFSVE